MGYEIFTEYANKTYKEIHQSLFDLKYLETYNKLGYSGLNLKKFAQMNPSKTKPINGISEYGYFEGKLSSKRVSVKIYYKGILKRVEEDFPLNDINDCLKVIMLHEIGHAVDLFVNKDNGTSIFTIEQKNYESVLREIDNKISCDLHMILAKSKDSKEFVIELMEGTLIDKYIETESKANEFAEKLLLATYPDDTKLIESFNKFKQYCVNDFYKRIAIILNEYIQLRQNIDQIALNLILEYIKSILPKNTIKISNG